MSISTLNKGGRNISFILSEKEKYDKHGMGSHKVKDIFNLHQFKGFSQVAGKEDKFRKLYNFAYGAINPEDYLGDDLPQELGFSADALDDHGLSFYPMVPNILNSVIDGYDKSYMEYYAQAINKENTNEIIKTTNEELRDTLVRTMTKLFLSENPNVEEEEFKLFQESEEIIKAKQLNYRTTIEQWANHMLRFEDQKFNMKSIGRKVLEQIFVTENPTLHINYSEGDYYPEVWNEKDCFYLRNPYSNDYSDSFMFGNFNYLNIGGVINKYSNKLNEESILQLEQWNSTYNSGFVINDQHSAITGNRVSDQEATQNFITFKMAERRKNRRYDDIDSNLIRETTIYFMLPRKAYKLTYKSSNITFSDIVGEEFKVTSKPIYKKGVPKSEYSLIEGEHLEVFYFNELWRGICLEANITSNNFNTSKNGEKIWIELKKHDIQYSDPQFRYGIRMPIHGGSQTNFYNNSYSITEKCASWQIMYNWIWNRNSQLLATEVGKFFVINQNMIPHESMGESWGKSNLIKWLLTGRDSSIAPIDASVGHLGQSNLQTGIGQVVDLTKTTEIIEKAELARRVKIECYSLVGLTEDFLYGNISPNQTATSVSQGLQRSSSQIQHLYTRLNNVMTMGRNTMLETAQYIASTNPSHQISYMSSDGARAIFETKTEGFLLHKVGVFVKNTIADSDVLERIKQNAMINNTMGANTLEISGIQVSKSIPEVMEKLKELDRDKKRELEKEREFQLQKQKEAFEQQQQILQQQEQKEARIKEREHEKDILVAQIRATGYGQGSPSDISKEVSQLESLALKQQAHEEKIRTRDMMSDFKERQRADNIRDKDLKRLLDEKIKLKQLAQKDKELEIREKEAINTDERTNKL